MFVGLGERPWFYSSSRSIPSRTIPSLVVGTCDYGGPINVAFRRGNVAAVQFHPEKSARRTGPARQLRRGSQGPGLTTLLYPSIDLRAGNVVRLAQGDFDRETVYGGDAVRVAEWFCAQGATWIHVVDLDAARTGDPANRPIVAAIVAAVAGRAAVQTGGGVRTMADAVALAGTGVARVVMGSAAVADPALVDTGRLGRAGGRRARPPRRPAGRPRLDATPPTSRSRRP